MLSRFIDLKGFQPILFTGSKYSVSIEGKVVETVSLKNVVIGETSLGEPVARIDDGENTLCLKVAVLISVVFKRCMWHIGFWNMLDVHYVDGNVKNLHPSNLVWKMPAGGIKWNPTYYLIPGFSRYRINEQGNVYSVCVKRQITPYIDFYGYPVYGVQPDVGNRTIVGTHRLLALAFLEYGAEVNDLDVNHIDGVKNNNALDNLEWVDRQTNCQHAFKMDLRNDNQKVDVLNYKTGEILTYYSLSECARHLGLCGQTIGNRVKTSGQKIYLPGYQFKLTSDPTEWKKIDDLEKGFIESGTKYIVTVTQKSSGKEIFTGDVSEAAKMLGIKYGTLLYRLRSKNPFEDDNFIIYKKFY